MGPVFVATVPPRLGGGTAGLFLTSCGLSGADTYEDVVEASFVPSRELRRDATLSLSRPCESVEARLLARGDFGGTGGLLLTASGGVPVATVVDARAMLGFPACLARGVVLCELQFCS